MRGITVRLGVRSYPVLVGRGALSRVGREAARHAGDGRAYVVSSLPVMRLHGRALLRSLRAAGLKTAVLPVPDGERAKTLSVAEGVLRRLARGGAGRDSCVVAFGGGTVGDLGGLVASLYARGVKLVQVPTTLLAQVDASIGGKTGVDLPEGKNLAGTFHQPAAVIADTGLLATLPGRQLRAGLAEVVKYGVIASPALFSLVERGAERLLRPDAALLERVVAECARIKARIVSLDEREGHLRMVLNFGHTGGHAVESASGYRLLHGEAVSIGMAAAMRLSASRGICDRLLSERVTRLLARLGLPVRPPAGIPRARIRSALMHDKKRRQSGLRFILTRRLGDVRVSTGVHADEIIGILGRKGEPG